MSANNLRNRKILNFVTEQHGLSPNKQTHSSTKVTPTRVEYGHQPQKLAEQSSSPRKRTPSSRYHTRASENEFQDLKQETAEPSKRRKYAGG